MNLELFGDIENVHVYFDDIFIAANTEEEHDIAFKKVLQRAREAGVRFNQEKLQYKVNEVEYLRKIIKFGEMKPSPTKSAAIAKLPTPKSKEDICRFLGMANYFGAFIPNTAK